MAFVPKNSESHTIVAQESATKLLREVGSSGTTNAFEKLFYVDRNSGEVYDKKPIFFRKDLTYYIVNSDEELSFKGLTKEISELDNSYTVNIEINYQVKIKNNPPSELVKLLLSENSVGKALNVRILKWIMDFASKEPGFIRRFFDLREMLSNFIVDEAAKLGIQIKLAISLKEGELISKPISINGKITVRVRDYFGKIPLSYDLELEAIPEKRIDAIIALFNKDKLQQNIDDEIKNVIHSANSINLHFLYFKLQNEIRETIFRKLDVFLDRYGLKPVFVNLNIQLQNIPPQREQLEYSVKCVTRHKYDVTVNHNLILNLKNLGIYFSSNTPNLNSKVKNDLERITQDYLFDQEFTNLTTLFDSQPIKDEMAREMEKIGYEIKQLITVPKLEGIIPDYFSFEVGKETEFATQQDEVKVKLNIIVTGRITNIEKLKKYLNPSITSESIIYKMKEAIVNSVRILLHSIDSERFYMRFDYSEEQGETVVSKLITKELTEKLQQEFGAGDLEIIPKQIETELVLQFNSMRGVSHAFEFENFSRYIRFSGNFMVVKVAQNGWYLFKAKCDAHKGKGVLELLKEIAQTMKNYIETELDTFSSYDFKMVKGSAFMEQIVTLLQRSVNIVKAEYGLVIQISRGLKRLPTPIERELQEKQKLNDNIREIKIADEITKFKIEKGHEKGYMNELLKKRREILEAEDVDERQIQEQLDRIQKGGSIARDLSEEIEKMEAGLPSGNKLNLSLPEAENGESNKDKPYEINV